MTLENVIYETIDSIAHITIDRPHKLNSLNSRTLTEIMEVFSLAASDPQVKAVILIGAGDKAFVAGADIEELSELNALGGKRFAERGQEIFNFIESMSKPVIAAVNGFALGGGCELCMACHIRVASENAKFGQPEVRLGIIPGFGGTQRLPRLVGKGRAIQLILTGDIIGADEAYRIGLVNKMVPYAGFIEIEKDGKKKEVPDLSSTRNNLIEEARKIARKIMENAPLSITFAIEAISRGVEMHLFDGQDVEADLFGMSMSTEDFGEGTKAFLEKRKPDWKCC